MPDGLTITWDPSPEVLIRQLDKFSRRAHEESRELTQKYAFVLRDTVRMNARRRPGPMVRSGEYIQTIIVVETKAGSPGFLRQDRDSSTFSVTTNHPASRRLEFGFYGRDSAGRIYNQRPYPHWRPAIDKVGKAYLEDSRKSVRRWWNG